MTALIEVFRVLAFTAAMLSVALLAGFGAGFICAAVVRALSSPVTATALAAEGWTAFQGAVLVWAAWRLLVVIADKWLS